MTNCVPDKQIDPENDSQAVMFDYLGKPLIAGQEYREVDGIFASDELLATNSDYMFGFLNEIGVHSGTFEEE